MKRTQLAAILLPLATLATPAIAQSPSPPLAPHDKLLREIYQEFIEINTTDSVGDCTQASKAMAARLKTGGYSDAEMQIIVPRGGPKKGNLVARLEGTGAKKPLMLLAHIDAVEAKREDWERDPFKLIEEGGYFCARGSSDDKSMAAIFVSNMIRYKQEKLKPVRDIILPTFEKPTEETYETYGVRVTINFPATFGATFGATYGVRVTINFLLPMNYTGAHAPSHST